MTYLDEDTTAVISLLIFNLVTVAVIILGWLLMRRCRGDKQNIQRHMSVATEIMFDSNFRSVNGGRDDTIAIRNRTKKVLATTRLESLSTFLEKKEPKKEEEPKPMDQLISYNLQDPNP